MGRKSNKAQHDYLRKRYAEGATYQQMGNELGISRQRAHQILHGHRKRVGCYKGLFTDKGGSWVTVYRAYHNLDRYELAEKTNLSYGIIRKIESGKIVTGTTAKRITDFFEVPIDSLFKKEEAL